MASRGARRIQQHRIARASLFSLAARALRPLLYLGTLLLSIIFAYKTIGTIRTAVTAKATPVLKIWTTPRSDECWVFTHLQKAGGTTVKAMLSDTWRSKFVIYDSSQWKKGDSYLQAFGRELASGQRGNLIAGGYPEALRRSTGAVENCRWFTQFRHPIPRLVSAFYYCKRSTLDAACATMVVSANEVSLEAFAKHWGNFAVRQFALSLVDTDAVLEYSKTEAARKQLPESVTDVSTVPGWYLLKMYLESGYSHNPAPVAAASGHVQIPDAALYEMLQPIQDLLRDNYTAVGILEEFDTTLSLYDASLAMPGLDWHKKFRKQGKKTVEKLYSKEEAVSLAGAWTNSEIKKYMHLDIVLYEHAVDVFRRQTQAYGV